MTFSGSIKRAHPHEAVHAPLRPQPPVGVAALHDELGVQIEGTPEVEESILCVPLRYGDRVTGVIVLSNLGLDQFDGEDIRIVEVLVGIPQLAIGEYKVITSNYKAEYGQISGAAIMAGVPQFGQIAILSWPANR